MIGAFVLIGCNGDGPTSVNVEVTAGAEFFLREGQVATIGGSDVSVQVTNIIDHRCPPDLSLSCQGISYSDLHFMLRVDGSEMLDVLRRETSGTAVGIDLDGWSLTFVDVLPAIRNSDKPINPRDLRAVLRLDELP